MKIELKYEAAAIFRASIGPECKTLGSVLLSEDLKMFHKSTESIKEVMPSLHSEPPLQRDVDLAFGLLAV